MPQVANLFANAVTSNNNIFTATKKGYGLWYDLNEVPVIGLKTTGVKSINLLQNDYVISFTLVSISQKIFIFTENGYTKCISMDEFPKQLRGGRGIMYYEVNEQTGAICKVIGDCDQYDNFVVIDKKNNNVFWPEGEGW